MDNMKIAALVAVTLGLSSPATFARNAKDSLQRSGYLPEIHGTIRAKYEYEPQISKGRFEIRNARINVEGKVIPAVKYKEEIDSSDEGKIKINDA